MYTIHRMTPENGIDLTHPLTFETPKALADHLMNPENLNGAVMLETLVEGPDGFAVYAVARQKENAWEIETGFSNERGEDRHLEDYPVTFETTEHAVTYMVNIALNPMN